MPVNIGPIIGIDGEAEYRKQINNIIQQSKTLGSEMKLVAAQFAASGDAQQKAAAMADVYAKQVDVQQKRVQALSDMLAQSTEKLGANDTATLKWQQAVNEASAALKTTQDNLAAVNQQLADGNGKTSAFGAAFKSLGNSVYLAATKLKTGKNETAALKSSYRDAKQEVADLTKEFNETAKQTGKTSDETKELAQKLNEARENAENLKQQFKESRQETSLFAKAMRAVGDGVKAGGTGIKGIASALGKGFAATLKTSVAAITAAGTAVVGLGKIGLDYNSQMEKYTTNFEVMLGSQEAAMEKVESLKTMAAKTPFEMAGLADATQQLLAMGVANEDTNKYLQQLGDISLGDSEKLGTLVNAFGKMNSTGKVSLEYINMMAEQGFNPLNLIAEKTGETMTELYDRVSKGEVSFDEIKEAMETATSAGGQFYQGMEQASKTTEGMISTLQDNATALVGEVFAPISDSLKDELLPTAIDAVDKLSTAFQEDGVEGMIEAAGDIVGETLGTFSSALPQFVDSAVSIVKSLLRGITDNLDSIADGAVSTVEALIEGFMDMLPDIIVTGALLLGKLAVGLIEAIPQLIGKIPEIVTEIKNGFAEKADEWKNIGQNIIRGLWEGLKSLGSWLGEKVSGLLGGTVKSAKSELDIHSPSGVFEELGEYSALGYGKGWENKIKGVRAAVSSGLNFGGIVPAANMISPSSTSNSTINYGGISIVVNGAPGQDVNQLADVVMQRIDRAVRRKEAVFGGI